MRTLLILFLALPAFGQLAPPNYNWQGVCRDTNTGAGFFATTNIYNPPLGWFESFSVRIAPPYQYTAPPFSAFTKWVQVVTNPPVENTGVIALNKLGLKPPQFDGSGNILIQAFGVDTNYPLYLEVSDDLQNWQPTDASPDENFLFNLIYQGYYYSPFPGVTWYQKGFQDYYPEKLFFRCRQDIPQNDEPQFPPLVSFVVGTRMAFHIWKTFTL